MTEPASGCLITNLTWNVYLEKTEDSHTELLKPYRSDKSYA